MGCSMLFALRPDMFTWYPKPAPRIANIARVLLIVHGLANMAQGFYSIMNPSGWRTVVPPSFAGTPDAAIQAIGLGALGVGWYQFIFACQNNRALFVATIPLRIVYAFVVARIAGWDAVAYELCVWALANCAAYLQVDSDPRSRASTKNES